MKNKSLDGLTKIKIKKTPRLRVYHSRAIKVDSIISRPPEIKTPSPRLAQRAVFFVPKVQKPRHVILEKWMWVYNQKRVPILAAVIALFLAFGGGVWSTLSTSKSQADQPQVQGEVTSQPSLAVSPSPVPQGQNLGQLNTVPNSVLFSMTIGQVENYLAQAGNTPELKEAQLLADRKEKLQKYLQEKSSPLVEIVNTLAELKHWQMVLAISNSESSLGKRCANQNCSGIGIEPGNPLWRTYPNKAAWAKDLDRLLEKRYKDWTLDEMNGVYNKPGSENWLMASKQILEDLQERGIE